jgi:hypothetical protein
MSLKRLNKIAVQLFKGVSFKIRIYNFGKLKYTFFTFSNKINVFDLINYYN